MALTKVDSKTYSLVVDAVPDSKDKVVGLMRPGSIYYVRQYIFDPTGRLVAFHDDDDMDGQRWADVSLLK